jgi:hypothetical protein
MSSMIVELASAMSSQDANIESLTYQNTLLPAPAMKSKTFRRWQGKVYELRIDARFP